MNKHIMAGAFTVACLAGTPVFAATVNFEQGQDTATYTAQGLSFGPGFSIRNNTFGGAVVVPSGSNYASADATGVVLSFVDTVTGAATTTNGFGLTIAGLNQGFGFYSGATLSFLGATGTLLGTQTFGSAGPFEGRSPITYSTGLSGIASVVFTRNENASGSGLFPFDDVTFNLQPVSGAIPEPAAWALMMIGFGAVGTAVRRRKVATRVTFA